MLSAALFPLDPTQGRPPIGSGDALAEAAAQRGG